MKPFLTILFSISIFLNISAQTLKKTYYDPRQETKIKEKYYVNSENQKHGLYIKYDDRGLKAVEITFTNGKPNGVAKEYALPLIGYPGDEKVKKISNYVNGELQGKTSYYVYLIDGKENIKEGKQTLQGEEYYEKNEKVREIAYFINGKKEIDAYLKNGKQSKWYDNGVLAVEFHVVNGVYNGTWKEWYTNGQIGIDGVKSHGKWFGAKKEWYPNGNIKSLQHFAEGDTYGEIYEGEQVYSDSLGNKIKQENYSPFLNNQQKIVVENFCSTGELESKWTQINTGRSYQNVAYEGDYLMYHKSGEISFGGNLNKRGNREGLWKRFDESGKILDELSYSDGYKAGKWTLFYDVDWKEVNSMDEATFYREIIFSEKGNLTDNLVIDYYKNGKKQFEGKLTGIDPDIINGSCIYYYENGNKESEGTMVHGQKSGNWTDYHPNGNIEKTSTYTIYTNYGETSYKENGTWYYYNEEGKKYKQEIYSFGNLTSTKDIKIK